MSGKPKKKISGVPLIVLDLLRQHPDGLDIEQIREIGGIKGQQHLDKRVRELYPFFEDYQTDWRKRLRELRYFGLEIETKNVKEEKRTLSRYRLNNWVDLPTDLSEAARRFEVDRAKRNRLKDLG